MDELLTIDVDLQAGTVDIGSEFTGVDEKAYSAYFVYVKRLK